MADQILIYNPAQQMFVFASPTLHHGNPLIEGQPSFDSSSFFELQLRPSSGPAWSIYNPARQTYANKTNELLNGDPLLEGLSQFAFTSQLFDFPTVGNVTYIRTFDGLLAFISDDVLGSNVVEAHSDDTDSRNGFLLLKPFTPPEDGVIETPVKVSLFSTRSRKIVYTSDDTQGSDFVVMGRDLKNYDSLFEYELGNWNGEAGKYTLFNKTYLNRSTVEVRFVHDLVLAGASGTEDTASFQLQVQGPGPTFTLFNDAARKPMYISDTGYHYIGGNDEIVATGSYDEFLLLQRYDPHVVVSGA